VRGRARRFVEKGEFKGVGEKEEVGRWWDVEGVVGWGEVGREWGAEVCVGEGDDWERVETGGVCGREGGAEVRMWES
jgi:hypothetical protein